MARRSTARPSPAWAGDLPVFERTLPNGLKALVLPRRHAPVVVSDLYYPVGSVNEPPGKTGLAHFVEHMLFKGTERYPKGQIDRLAFVAAGQTNAETGEDFTHYWFAFPSDRWELCLALEADRMRGAAFDPREVEAERHVIIEERARDQDSPAGRLDQTHLALSYLRHPYRNPILGWPEDLAGITVDDLRGFYESHYRPDGAVLVVVGDVEPGPALDRIEAQFGGVPRGPLPRPRLSVSEPRQTGRRDFALVENESVARALYGWHSVPQGHPDAPALDVLADLLTFGRRARLWEALVEDGKLATNVDAGQEGSRHAGQFLVQIEAPAGTDSERVEGELRRILDQLADEGPTPEELERSRNRLEAAWRWEQEDLAGLAAGLGGYALWDDWRAWQAGHRAAIAVGPDDIRRVVSAYLVEAGLTAGWSVPRPAHSVTVLLPSESLARPDVPRPSAPPAPEVPADLPTFQIGSRLTDYRPRRFTLPNGMRVLTERRAEAGVVALELFVDAGLLRESRPGLAYLTGRMLEEGTTRLTAEELATAIEDVGGTLDLGSTGASVRVRAEDLPLALDLLADVTMRPAFPAEALSWTRRRISSELQSDRDDPGFRADLLFRGLVYGTHPYARDPRGTGREIGRLTHEEVVAHHARYFKPDHSFLVAVGDVEPRRLMALVRARFGAWEPSGLRLPGLPKPVRAPRPKVRRVSHPGEQVQIAMGHLGVARNHPDFDALAVLDHILGSGPGFTDRLSRVLRDEMGLAYAVGGGITDSADVLPGVFRVFAGTLPEETDRVVAAVIEQVRAVHAGEFSDEEVDRARRYLAGSWVFDYQTVEQRAERLMELERWALPLDEPEQWPDRVGRVTTGQVRRAARTHLHPDQLSRVEYGPLRRRQRGVDAECA